MGADEICTEELLFPISKATPLSTRTTVPLLDAKYSNYKVALSMLEADWLNGRLGSGQPVSEDEIEMIHHVNKEVNGAAVHQHDDETQRIYDLLVDIKVPGHLKNTTSHRHWLQKTLQFCKTIGIKFTDNMDSLIRRHDLSKYTHREVVGYAVMFGDGSTGFRPLEKEEEKDEWQITLNNHYAANPHHPEYFGIPAKGESQKHSMVDLHGENSDDFHIESVIDMLASHGERNLKDDATFSMRKWMEINPRFLARYEVNDRVQVENTLQKWLHLALDYISDDEKAESLKPLFDGRQVTE